MGIDPEQEQRLEAYLFDELGAAERAELDQELAQSPEMQAALAARSDQKKLMRRSFLREKIRDSKAEFGALVFDDSSLAQGGRVAPIANGQLRWAMAAAVALALGAASWWLWGYNERLETEIAAMKSSDLPAVRAAEPSSKDDSAGAVEPRSAPRDAEKPKIAQRSKPKNDASNGPAPQIYAHESGTIRGGQTQASPRTKGEEIFNRLDFAPDLRLVKVSQPTLAQRFEKGKYAELIELLKRADLSDPNVALYLSGICHLKLGDAKAAIEQLDSLAIKGNPFRDDARWAMAFCFLKQDQLEAAKKIFSDFSKMNGSAHQKTALKALDEF